MLTSDTPGTDAMRGRTLSSRKSRIRSMSSWRGLPGSGVTVKNMNALLENELA